MRILGIDYGDARTGLSVSDELEIIASPLKTYKSQSMRKDIDYIAALVSQLNAQLIVLGLPLNMDGSEGARANKTRAFGRVLERVSGVPIIYQDERLTSVEAEEILISGGVRREKRKDLIDSMAARIILQNYLDSNKKNGV